MPGTKLNAHGGFIPAAVAPPNAIISELVIHHHRCLCAETVTGYRHGPPP